MIQMRKSRFQKGLVVVMVVLLFLLPGCEKAGGDEKVKVAKGMTGIKNDLFYVGIYTNNGGINRIQNMKDSDLVNFVVGFDEFIGRESGSKWLGDVDFEYRLEGGDWQEASTTYSEDVREVGKRGDQELLVEYLNASSAENGIRDFSLAESYRLEGEELIWEVTINNTSANSVEFGSIGFPLMFNSPLNGTVTEFYEQTTYAHSCVAYQGSYFYASRNCGDGPILMMYPKGMTSIEYQNWPDTATQYECQTIYTCAAKKVMDAPGTETLPPSTLLLEAGQKITYTFGFSWADTFEQMNKILYERGKIAVTSLPGMVTSTDLPVSLDLYTKQSIVEIEAQYAEQTDIKSLGMENDHHRYQLSFSQLGENRITVHCEDGSEMALLYFVTEPLERLIQKNCEFICKNQQQTDPDDPAYMGFLPWDMVMENLNGDGLTDNKNDQTLGYFPTGWWHCGGDEMGYTPGLYLSEKNVYWPDESQIKQLVDYLNIFIYDTMTEIYEDGTVHLHRGAPWGYLGDWDSDPRMDPDGRDSNKDCWRSYNYPHIINTYYNMYRIAAYYDFDIEGMLGAEEYLMHAYDLAYTFFTAWMYPAGMDERGQGGIHYGNMGETMFQELVETLRKEGMTDKAEWLQEQLDEKAAYYQSEDYPYTSESAFDTAAYEAVYSYAKMIGDEELVKEVTATNISTRGQTPVWYLYGSDLPSQDGGVCLRYMTQVGGMSLLDYTLNYSDNRAYDIKLAYGSYMAGWALINSGYYDDNPNNLYSSIWYYQGRKGKTMHSVNSWEKILPIYNGGLATSGESALGFWAALHMASTVISDDPVFGVYAYGGKVNEAEKGFTIIPNDGVRKRVHLLNMEEVVSIELLQDQISSLKIAKNADNLSIKVDNVTGSEHTVDVQLTGIEAGSYTISVNGTAVGKTKINNGQTAEISYTAPAGTAYELSISK